MCTFAIRKKFTPIAVLFDGNQSFIVFNIIEYKTGIFRFLHCKIFIGKISEICQATLKLRSLDARTLLAIGKFFN